MASVLIVAFRRTNEWTNTLPGSMGIGCNIVGLQYFKRRNNKHPALEDLQVVPFQNMLRLMKWICSVF